MPPRSAPRQRNATPARATRATSNAAHETPASRRSTRSGNKQPSQTRNSVSNPALPEIQTHQSYAYGASKAPALPEQLQARDMTMDAVADRMRNAIESAEKNFEAQAADTRGYTPESQVATRTTRARKQASNEPSPQSNTPEQVRKTQRTAAWVESSQLDDITEESSENGSPNRRAGSEPSSFPSGILEHSYNYERGLRGPQLAYHLPWRERLRQFRLTISTYIENSTSQILEWLSRIILAIRKSLGEIPESKAFVALVKVIVFTTALAFCSLLFCAVWSRGCAPDSPSVISQSLSKLCGRCTNDPSGFSLINFNASVGDIDSFNKVLNARYDQLQAQIQKAHSRFNSKIDNNQLAHAQEIESLRQQQHAIELQLRRLGGRGSQGAGSNDAVASPLIPKINFFSPANGALIDPHYTSPTRQKLFSYPTRFVMRMFDWSRYDAQPPITALNPWLDEGDCWCAAESAAENQDSLRLTVSVRELMYPTELVIEHFPAEGSLAPDNAPRDLELWADFSHLSHSDFQQRLRIPDLQAESGRSPFGQGSAWARIGTATYAAGNKGSGHVQSFSLDVNQNGNLHHADTFMLRVTKNYGADYTCLYRVRLHGEPVKERKGISGDQDHE